MEKEEQQTEEKEGEKQEIEMPIFFPNEIQVGEVYLKSPTPVDTLLQYVNWFLGQKAVKEYLSAFHQRKKKITKSKTKK